MTRSLTAVVFVLTVMQSASVDAGTQPAQERSDTEVVDSLVAAATKEGAEDTGIVDAVRIAADRVGLYPRENAFAVIPVALGSVAASDDSSRRVRRRAELVSGFKPIVLEGLKSADGVVRRYAFAAMGAMSAGDPSAHSDFMGLAKRLFEKDAEAKVRAVALGVLVRGGRSQSANWTLLESALKDPSPEVKSAAYSEVALARPPQAVPYILEGLSREDDPWLRLSAANALVNFVRTNPEVVEAVADRAAVESESYIKEQLVLLLGRMKEVKKQR